MPQSSHAKAFVPRPKNKRHLKVISTLVGVYVKVAAGHKNFNRPAGWQHPLHLHFPSPLPPLQQSPHPLRPLKLLFKQTSHLHIHVIECARECVCEWLCEWVCVWRTSTHARARTHKWTKRYVLITANARIFPHRILWKKATPEFTAGSHLLVLFLFAKHFTRSKHNTQTYVPHTHTHIQMDTHIHMYASTWTLPA